MTSFTEMADDARAKCADKISAIADARMRNLCGWFARAYPKRRLHIIFGMGDEHVSIDDVPVDISDKELNPNASPWATDSSRWLPVRGVKYKGRWVTGLLPLYDAMQEVLNITNGYHDGCPNDVTVEPTITKGKS